MRCYSECERREGGWGVLPGSYVVEVCLGVCTLRLCWPSPSFQRGGAT